MVISSIAGGAKLEEALAKLSKKVSKKVTLRVGFLEGAKYPDGTSVAMVAAIQEFGAPRAGIPPRPYFRPMVAQQSNQWGEVLGRCLVAADYNPDQALGIIGERIGGELQESITKVQEPALSPVTLMLRSLFPVTSGGPTSRREVVEARMLVELGESPGSVSTKPLVWTDHLLKSVGHDVTDEA